MSGEGEKEEERKKTRSQGSDAVHVIAASMTVATKLVAGLSQQAPTLSLLPCGRQACAFGHEQGRSFHMSHLGP